MRKLLMGVAAALVSVAFVAVTTSVASAKTRNGAVNTHTLWVATHAANGNGKSCAQNGFSSISSAIAAAAPNAMIHVCSGTYTEQPQITKALSISASGGPVTVALPASPVVATTSCDTAIDAALGSFPPDQDGISVCTTGTVKLTGITVDASFPSVGCSVNDNGIVVGGGATLDFNGSAVTAAGVPFTSPDNGCQSGVAIQAGLSVGAASGGFNNNSPVTVGHLNISHSTISGYQKNGITVDGSGSHVTMSHVTITGNGPGNGTTPENNAQNGVQVSDGATATIRSSAINDNEYEFGVPASNNSATGILFYNPGVGSTVKNSAISVNDIGVYSYTPNSSVSAVLIKSNRLDGDRAVAIQFDQGFTTATNNRIANGSVGLQATQYSGQSYAVHAVTSRNTITGMSTATVQVSSDALGPPQDIAGSMSVTNSRISSGPVLNNSKNFTLTLSNNH
jgi:hypothetical protein